MQTAMDSESLCPVPRSLVRHGAVEVLALPSLAVASNGEDTGNVSDTLTTGVTGSGNHSAPMSFVV